MLCQSDLFVKASGSTLVLFCFFDDKSLVNLPENFTQVNICLSKV